MSRRPGIARLRRTLRDTFKLRQLRQGQEEVIRSVLEARDTLAIMPTGAGKSLCYQLPALELPGTTIVVSPLISLMKDQADKLDELGVAVSQVNSSLTTREENASLESIEEDRSEFVFTTPERITTPSAAHTLACFGATCGAASWSGSRSNTRSGARRIECASSACCSTRRAPSAAGRSCSSTSASGSSGSTATTATTASIRPRRR